MRIVIEIDEARFKDIQRIAEVQLERNHFQTAEQIIAWGTPLPEGAEILTKEAYSDLCLRASRIPCYLGSPCEYQNEDIKMLNPHPPVQYIAEIKISENDMEEIVRKAEQRLKDSEWHPNIVVDDTCKNIGEDYAECDQFVCSECGIEIQDWHRVERDMDDGEVSYHEYTFRFCPNCGRRIVEGAEE